MTKHKSSGKYVSRGGDKLEGALSAFGIDVRGAHCLDAGASTGGFTDCMLKSGAADVASVDVAYGQFDWGLRNDERVRLFERTNIRNVGAAELGGPFDVIACDISFSSLAGLGAVLYPLLSDEGSLIALIKPQFELPKDILRDAKQTGVKGGIIIDTSLQVRAVSHAIRGLSQEGFVIRGATHSPIKGTKGNIEFFVWAQKGGDSAIIDIESLVSNAHKELD
ncbi:MAG: TlyA family RNA methyltransferase [Coriobacteriales bacterium]|jgi:23S rRNA (cytidine1920-2'-O)/16S rRNA (cytidine1409-2'-O)-methyltransferase|nr:TlyA family RNA methyltransferase [Coriobacteriales bacterium]